MEKEFTQQFISLLYPDEASKNAHREPGGRPNISETVTDELGLTEIFHLKNASLTEFFTSDPEVILYRQQTVRDCLECPELREALARVRPILDDIRQLRILEDDATARDAYLYSITEIELYVSSLRTLYEGLSPLRGRLHSPAFLALCELLAELCESEYYRELNDKLSALSQRVHEIKSITVGVNLDAQLRPTGAGVLSVNAESFKSGKVLDKILRLSFRNDAFTCIAPLTPLGKGQSENRQEALIGAFNGAIEEVYHSAVKGWRAIVDEYVLDSTDFLLQLIPEIEFLSRSCELLDRLRNHAGCAITFAELAPREEKAFFAEGLYNPRVALAIDDEIVTNDIDFDDDAKIYILTGPNRGGKSVITVAVGAAQSMLQLGLPVPAHRARLSVVDGIFTHFPEGADDTIDKGRLGEECARLRDIFDAITEDSMILLDESLSSTGAYEATYIASEILVAFGAHRVRGVFSTHLHELAATVNEINERSVEAGGIRLDTLVAGMEEGRRSFRIRRAKPDGRSYARDIADKYGLSFENLMKKEDTPL